MAFFSKVGNILRQTTSKPFNAELSASKPSIYQAIRYMSSSKLFVGGISYSTDEQSLQEAFSKYGEVVEARVIVDRETGRSRGFGFVTYTSSEEASSAIQALDGQDLHGRRVRVNYANDRARGGFGGGYGGGFGGSSGGYGGGYGGGNAGGYGGGYGASGGNYGGNSPYGGGGGGDNYGNNDSYGSGGADHSYGTGGNMKYGVAGAAGGNDNYASSGTSGGYDGSAGSGYDGGNQFGSSDQFTGGSQFGGGENLRSGDQYGSSEGKNNLDDTSGDFGQDEPVTGNWRDDDDTNEAKRA